MFANDVSLPLGVETQQSCQFQSDTNVPVGAQEHSGFRHPAI